LDDALEAALGFTPPWVTFVGDYLEEDEALAALKLEVSHPHNPQLILTSFLTVLTRSSPNPHPILIILVILIIVT
jgi:hypothetical protein